MSTAFHEASKALSADPELAARVMAAATPAERASILEAAGIAAPTHAEVSAAHSSLSDVSGAGAATTARATAVMCAEAPAAASATAAG